MCVLKEVAGFVGHRIMLHVDPKSNRDKVSVVCLVFVALGFVIFTRERVFPEPGNVLQRATYGGAVMALLAGIGLFFVTRIGNQRGS